MELEIREKLTPSVSGVASDFDKTCQGSWITMRMLMMGMVMVMKSSRRVEVVIMTEQMHWTRDKFTEGTARVGKGRWVGTKGGTCSSTLPRPKRSWRDIICNLYPLTLCLFNAH